MGLNGGSTNLITLQIGEIFSYCNFGVSFCHDISYNLIVVKEWQGLNRKEKIAWRY